MDRRRVLSGIGAGVLSCGAAAGRAAPVRAAGPGDRTGTEPSWRTHEVVTEIEVAGLEGPCVAFAPLFETRGGWQTASAPSVATSGRARVVRDARYGAPVVRAEFAGGEGARTLRIVQRVRTRDRGPEARRLGPDERAFWTASLPSLPREGVVAQTAARITAGRVTPRERARAIYDWVVTNTFRDAAVRGCGAGGVENMLLSGYLGGKCADINGLTVALCRAAGLPARDVYGVRLGPSKETACLGVKGPEITRAQHCRAEVHLEGEGWVPIDPADVRKIVLETKASVDSPEVAAARERLFGSWEGNWAAYNSATDIVLPKAPRAPAERFLMYPTALAADREADQLDPDRFRYAITATAV